MATFAVNAMAENANPLNVLFFQHRLDTPIAPKWGYDWGYPANGA